ncbi:formyltransferase [Jeongeupia chitinilytica]|uniref:Formyltransferase n=1 Tax=Jeongeupia chitinilytica TaxID=1041641 RepID=A0ABQ3H043_9NEIS|nr:formyltransferase [Jeongeupia chitinilytica]GHD60989.1 formyltransferase [Jeongeupia chitinilytica]
MTRAVVFAYHNVGVRSLRVLLAQGIRIDLVVTHEDNPDENIWFGSVAQVCRDCDIPYITPADPNVPEVEARIAALAPDFVFSFYYRHMLKAPILAAPSRGAFNLHGSLLPQYRGRVPVNWAIIHGETETGVTLHVMNIKPDNGAIVDQLAVPILPDDTAHDVFEKVAVAGELCLHRALPRLVAGTATFTPQDLSQGGYFGGRKLEDGRIDWRQSAQQLHDLVRAVTHPYPGAFSDTPRGRLTLWRTRRIDAVPSTSDGGRVTLWAADDKLWLRCADGGLLRVLDATLDGKPLKPDALSAPLEFES